MMKSRIPGVRDLPNQGLLHLNVIAHVVYYKRDTLRMKYRGANLHFYKLQNYIVNITLDCF